MFEFLKRADKYIKTYKADQEVPENRSLSPEECETIMLRRKRDKEELELHKTVELENDSGQTEYFCHANGLNCDHCTWEQQDEVRPIARAMAREHEFGPSAKKLGACAVSRQSARRVLRGFLAASKVLITGTPLQIKSRVSRNSMRAGDELANAGLLRRVSLLDALPDSGKV